MTTSIRKDWKTALILVYATLAIVVDFYNFVMGTYREELDSLVLYFVLPLLLLLLLRRSPTRYGFRLGDWRKGLLYTLGGCLLMAPILWFVARGADFQQYYVPYWQRHGAWGTFLWAVQGLIGWEFLFRGLLLFALADICDDWAILLQAMLFTLAHLTKPQLETLSCIVGGSAFGWVAWRTKSFYYPFLIHLFVIYFTIWVAQL